MSSSIGQQKGSIAFLLLGVAFLLGTYGYADEDFHVRSNAWRWTTHGWELAHSLPTSESDGTSLEFTSIPPTIRPSSLWIQFHRCLLPVAIAALYATLLPYLLIHLPSPSVKPCYNRQPIGS